LTEIPHSSRSSRRNDCLPAIRVTVAQKQNYRRLAEVRQTTLSDLTRRLLDAQVEQERERADLRRKLYPQKVPEWEWREGLH
jgi:hypothetical protein